MTEQQKGGVIDLQIEDYKKIKSLHVKLAAGVNQIGGPNGAGKSSGLDGIANVFGGKRLTPTVPVRKGAKGFKLQVTLEKLGLLIKRIGTLDKEGRLNEELIVSNAEGLAAGARLGHPQEILNKLMGGFSVTLQSLTEMTKAEQIALLQEVTGLDFTALNAKRVEAYEARTAANRLVKELQAQLDNTPELEDAPDKLVSVSDLIAELSNREEINRANLEKWTELETLGKYVIGINQDRDRILNEIKELEATLKSQVAECEAALADQKRTEKLVAKLVDADVAEVRAQIESADAINEKVRAKQARVELVAEHGRRTKIVEGLNTILEKVATEKETMLASAKFPVPGMSFDEEGIYLNGLPIEQASQVEQMQVDVGIAVARNPGVPIILMNKGSLYDKEHREELDRIAKEHGVFVAFEQVMNSIEEAETEGATVYMEDGVGINPRKEGALL